MTWIKGEGSDIRTWTEHWDAVPWHDAPPPRRLHCCSPQTRGWLNYGLTKVERCACGAISLNGGPWMERNQTRKQREENA